MFCLFQERLKHLIVFIPHQVGQFLHQSVPFTSLKARQTAIYEKPPEILCQISLLDTILHSLAHADLQTEVTDDASHLSALLKAGFIVSHLLTLNAVADKRAHYCQSKILLHFYLFFFLRERTMSVHTTCLFYYTFVAKNQNSSWTL